MAEAVTALTVVAAEAAILDLAAAYTSATV
jgi:hypothetical protein